MKQRILVVARANELRTSLVSALLSGGYAVEASDHAERARELAGAGEIALAILEAAALGELGAEFVEDVAAKTRRLIVVADDARASLPLGGVKVDAWITEPWVAHDLLARIETMLGPPQGARADAGREREVLTFEGFTLDVAGHTLAKAGGQEVPLSRAEFALLVRFVRAPGRVLSRSQLLSAITSHPDAVFDRSVDVMVWRLRRKIEPNPKRPRLILTVPGVGYKLAAKVGSTCMAPASGPPAEDLVALPMQTSTLRRHGAHDSGLPVERRHITVMACGLIGLDALSSRLDAEDINAVVMKYRRTCSEIVAQFGSFVTKFSGDRIHFYFGYPEAHEHDAEWAVRAGTQIVDAVAALASEIAVDLRVRIGIASGLVIVGDLGGGATAEIIGELPSVAGRLMSLAPPDAVLIASCTRELVGNMFRYKQIGPLTVAELPEVLSAWQVVGENMVESRFDALHASRLPPMVGREEEIELLLRRWRQSGTGDGRTVLISGEPGIGKSRLVKALAERIESEPHARLGYQCSPYHRNSALHPLLAQIERAGGFEMDDTPEERLTKLEEMLAIVGADRAEAMPLIAALLSIPTTGRYPPLALGAAQKRRRTLAILFELMAGLARQRPVLAIFEDANWADATSLEWLDLAISAARQLPIMMVITYRAEFKPTWSSLPGVTTLLLGRLGPNDVRAMIKGITRGHHLETSVIERIVDQTDGIPLYVEELTRMAMHSPLTPPRTRLDAADSPPAIPLTLQNSFMARVDQLGPAREVAQIGAAIGREFSYPLLHRLAELDDSTLIRGLERLEESELVFRRGALPEATYSFSHALLREAAYETLPKLRRQALHVRIAELLSDPASAPDETEPELIAYHFNQAGRDEAAAHWWGKAGDRALGRSAYAEAISNFRKALGLAQKLPAAPQQHRLLLRLQIGYGQALIASRGHGAPETTAAFLRARDLAVAIEDGGERLAALYGMWSGSLVRAELAPMRELASHFAQAVEGTPESHDARVVADRLLGVTAWFHGDYQGARAHLERAIAAYDAERHAPLAFRFGQDTGVGALVYLAIVLRSQGDPGGARRAMEAARDIALRSDHIPTIAYLRVHECALACVAADPQAARLPAEAVLDISRRHGLPQWLAPGAFCLGWSLWHAGVRAVGLGQMREAMELGGEQGAIFMPKYAFLRAEAEALSGDVEAGLALIVDQLAEIERSGQRWLEAELHRRHAELLIQRNPADTPAAEAAFARALDIARAQHATAFELRAAVGAARLYQSQSKIDAARAVLAPLSDALSEDSDMPEARDARRIILQLA